MQQVCLEFVLSYRENNYIHDKHEPRIFNSNFQINGNLIRGKFYQVKSSKIHSCLFDCTRFASDFRLVEFRICGKDPNNLASYQVTNIPSDVFQSFIFDIPHFPDIGNDRCLSSRQCILQFVNFQLDVWRP